MIASAGRLIAEIWNDRTGRIGLVLVVLILLFALVGPLVAANPNKINVADRFLPPSLTHLLGTDNLGRDLFARTAYGTRSALAIALVVVGFSLSIGAILGVAAGLIGGIFERVVLMLFDIVNSYPPVTLALGMVALYGTGYANLLFVVTILFIPQFGRVARVQTLAIRNQTFIDAERLLGLSMPKLILRHFVPNVIGPLIILASMNIPVVVTVEAGISFLGPRRAAARGEPRFADQGRLHLSQSVLVADDRIGDHARCCHARLDAVRRSAARRGRSQAQGPHAMTSSGIAIEKLSVDFETPAGIAHAVRDVSLTAGHGRIIGLVGESGSGKSTVGLSLMGLLADNARVTQGTLRLGKDRFDLTRRESTTALRGKRIAMIFQDPLSSLNPVFSIRAHLLEVMKRCAPHIAAVERKDAADRGTRRRRHRPPGRAAQAISA